MFSLTRMKNDMVSRNTISFNINCNEFTEHNKEKYFSLKKAEKIIFFLFILTYIIHFKLLFLLKHRLLSLPFYTVISSQSDFNPDAFASTSAIVPKGALVNPFSLKTRFRLRALSTKALWSQWTGERELPGALKIASFP